AGAWIGPFSLTAPPSLARADGPAGEKVRGDLEVIFAQMPAVPNATEKPLIGVFSVRAVRQDARDQAHDSAPEKSYELLAKQAAEALRQRSAQAFARRELAAGVQIDRLTENQNFAKGSPAWNLRHGMGKKADEKGSSPSPNPADVVKPRVQAAP